MNSYKHITHKDIPLFIDEESTVLILGSLPSVKSREYGFYYAHPQNRFYKVLGSIFGEDIIDRKQFLREHHIALYDVIYECDIIGSSDASIRNPVVIDIDNILSTYPHIKKIGINGNKAKALFDRYLLEKVSKYDVDIIYLPSTSPANARTDASSLVTHYQRLFE